MLPDEPLPQRIVRLAEWSVVSGRAVAEYLALSQASDGAAGSPVAGCVTCSVTVG